MGFLPPGPSLLRCAGMLAADHPGRCDALQAFDRELEPVAGLLRAAERDERVQAAVAVDPDGAVHDDAIPAAGDLP